ncbi:MAG: DNA double-strand break repair nuclease NurA [Candidatus Nitrosocaldaceae archaeon]
MNTQLNLPILDAKDLVECIDNALKRNKLKDLERSEILFNPEENLSPLNGWSNDINVNVKHIKSEDRKHIIAAVDSSAIFLADTAEGSLYASKCGISIAYDCKQITHFKIGPILFYLNENSITLDYSMIKRMIRVRVERALQKKLANTLDNAIILVDGSLKSSIFENDNSIPSILDDCKEYNNTLIGISKVSRLKLIEKLISSFHKRDACYIDISSILRAYISNLYGKQLLVKLSKDGLVLRADVINENDLSLLIRNDILHNGYPQTLRLAHHLSVFTRIEVIATISMISSKFKTSEIDSCNLRNVLLGKIGG